MKKLICALLCLCLLLTLAACGSSDAAATTAAAGDTRFRVGYARENITPDHPVGLTGYGNTSDRQHTEVLDYIYLTTVAITDHQDNTMLMITVDVSGFEEEQAASLANKAAKAAGIPKENVTISGTHTHSAPSPAEINTAIIKAVEKTVKAAMEDREYADMYMGTTQTKGLNFVRHYWMTDGTLVSDNHGDPTGKTYAGHTTEVDEQMQLLKFDRDGDKEDVVMVNWQSHPHITGGFEKYSLSADIIGAFREYLEKDTGCLFAYYQGAAGNINPTSRIKDENANTTSPKNYRVHGELLAGHAKDGLANMTLLEPGLIKVHTEQFEGECDHSDGALAAAASQVIAYFEEGHTPTETQRFAEPFGIWSVYHARAIGNRANKGKSLPIPITTFTIGQVGFATIPGELFDTIGMTIKAESPCAMTFVMGYCNGSVGYLASEYAFEYGTYEVDIRTFVKGTAEAVGDRHVELLKELTAK